MEDGGAHDLFLLTKEDNVFKKTNFTLPEIIYAELVIKRKH